jgi:hypothetical protein
VTDIAEVAADEAEYDERTERDDVDVRRRREQAARLLDAPQVREGDERDERETELDAMGREALMMAATPADIDTATVRM